jgi:hypothetical protein
MCSLYKVLEMDAMWVGHVCLSPYYIPEAIEWILAKFGIVGIQ